MKKQIVEILTNDFDPDVRVYKEAKYLVKKGYNVTILCWNREEQKKYPAKEILDGIEIVRFRFPAEIGTGKKQLPAFYRFYRQCKLYLKKNEYDYLHCNDIDGQLIGVFANSKKKPIVFDMHEYYEDRGEKAGLGMVAMWRRLTIRMIKKSIAALYENDLYLTQKYMSIHNKLFELKNYPSVELLKREEKTSSDKFRIGYFGGLRSQIPEFTTLFEAVKDMDDVLVDIRGDGPDYKKLCELAKNYKNVMIHGTFDGTKELSGLYSNVDMGYMGYRIWSSTKDKAELVKFFENIVTGTPILLTEAYTHMANKINDNGYGLTCDTLNIEQVRECIIRLKDDKEFWKKCHDNEVKDAHLYSWEEEIKVLDSVYE